MTHSQENVTDLPERVLLVASGPQKSSGHFYLSTSDETGAAIYVPESRALAAEQERDEASNSRDLLVETVDALQADLAALREKLREAERDLAIAGVRGSPPPWGDTTIGKLNARIIAIRAERDYLTLCLGEANASKDAAHEEVARLRAERDALVPLARLGLNASGIITPMTHPTREQFAAARAVLGKEGT